MVKKRINQLPVLGREPAAGDLVHVWDGQLGKSTQVDVTDLPGGGGGGGGSYVAVSAVFMVTTGFAGLSYDAGTGATTIKDERLLNKTDYPVSTDQFGGGDFHLSALTYNPVDPDDDTKGSVVIAGFQLDDAAHITIIVNGSRDASGDSEYNQLLADVALLKLVCAPLLTTALGANGGRVWWTGALADIPAGWARDTDWQGVVPVALDPDDDDFKTMGAAAGSKTHTNTLEEMVPHTHDVDIPSRDFANAADNGPDLTSDPAIIGTHRTFTSNPTGGYDPGTGKVAKPYSIMNPYKVGCWIKFIGIV
ncbi:hypothetical protein [Mucilaginibacter sp. L3T2-6]|uniref:hypothetical protein n=1 Tax=Mucilaginibacter sp. L3T2-6 TaxID=3062491 RepID=UPI002676ABB2|nr:hypothetical protein [Mucilaginibacter sp. L3T2-6]MDO3641981.1 hypothetical protein [Mucilaginibacter sp. L3T2-6]MDV6214341.1 hypothetical protein [Mucilaginibacter sp. L3T2-6]